MKRDRPFYGWTIISISLVTLAIGFGIWYSFSVFFVAILKEFGWDRASAAGVFSLFMLVHSGAAFFIGSLHDRFGPRKVIPMGSLLIVIGLLASSRIESLWQLYLSFGVLTAMGICTIGFVSQSILLPNWFLKKRGLALGIAMAGIGIGMQVFVPLAQYIISSWGWRAAYCLLAGTVICIVIPLNAIFQRRNPEEIGALPDGEKMPLGHKDILEESTSQLSVAQNNLVQWTLASSLRTRQFWFLFLTYFFIPMAVQGVLIHQVAHVVDKGFSAARGAFFFGLAGIVGSAGKILFGHLSDRIGRDRAFTMGMGCAFLGVLSLMNLSPYNGWLLYGYAIFFGLGYGSIAPIFPSRAADLFQGAHFGKIYGFIAISGGVGGAIGTWLSGKIFDLTASYKIAFLGVLTVFVLIVVLFWLTSPDSPEKLRDGTTRDHKLGS
jgi:MFS family permease